MPGTKTYLIGRSPDCDIVLADATISRRHAELVEGADGRFFLTDRESAAGSWTRRSGDWTKLRQAFVTLDEPLMLGRYTTSVKALLKLLAQQKGGGAGAGSAPTQVEIDLPIGGVMRNPLTGEIVRKG
jgi:predicted component of type VI protein secretion system